MFPVLPGASRTGRRILNHHRHAMNTTVEPIAILTALINEGETDVALQQVEALLEHRQYLPSLHFLKAEALRIGGRPLDAIASYRNAGALGAGARSWMLASVLMSEAQRFNEAHECLTYAHAEEPGSEEAMSSLITVLFQQILAGQHEDALACIEKWLVSKPGQRGLLLLKAEALMKAARNAEAIDAFRLAGKAGAGVRAWLAAGTLLAAERRVDESLDCLRAGILEEPGNEELLDTLVTTLFNAQRAGEGTPFAMRLLGTGQTAQRLSNAALLLQNVGGYGYANDAFKNILNANPNNAAIVGAAFVPARFACEWEWVAKLQGMIRECYDRGEYDAINEFPMTNVAWCPDERYNLEVARSYMSRSVSSDVRPLFRNVPLKKRKSRRIRVGYASSDFCHHATMLLMIGVFEHHDREQFEIFAYDYSKPDESDYRKRFLDAVEHRIDISNMTDADAAARIAEDELDILIDLKGHTGWARPGIMAWRAAPVQATYLGFPGSMGTKSVDYQITDRFVTPDSSEPFFDEALCRLPHSYQSNDRKRPNPAITATRAEFGLPEDAVVFCSFNQSYKIDRNTFDVWMRVMREVPNSVLWLLDLAEETKANLRAGAEKAGIDPSRLYFSGFAAPDQHIARLRLADAALDTLIYNGHTTTSDALWAGLPVVTAHGKHFASRVTESLLNAVNLPELVGADQDEMVRIAVRVGQDAAYRKQLREHIRVAMDTAPLYDTERFTRNFEEAIRLMVKASRANKTGAIIDVPDVGAN
jgi:protein O-GlcNAc transferase